ncbi:MAG: helix-turn-helix domain-containing protein [Pseudomonas sp.]|uniref:helix-turn-helix domain-containing protein n=1 Tax=Pseudomonas sp. TaxID=306 RepID=UPI0030F1088F
MLNKTYGQPCPIARTLDVIGERWTLLVIRELLLGPKRFKELLAMLPAMGANRLSARLRVLVENNIAQPTKSIVTAYELTSFGEQLRKPLLALGLWGLNLSMDERIDSTAVRAELVALSLSGVSRPGASDGIRAAYEFQVGAEVFHIRVDDGEVLTRSGPAPAADVIIRCDLATFVALSIRQISAEDALYQNRARLIQGQPSMFEHLFQMLEYSPKNVPHSLLALNLSSFTGTLQNES